MQTENKNYAPLFDVDADAVLKARFEAGEGVVQISPDMSDTATLLVIKQAAKYGKPFLVVPANQL